MKILLLGASGFLGGALWERLSARHHVLGTRMSANLPQFERLDLRAERDLKQVAARGWDVVLHAAGLVDLGVAEATPHLTWTLNVRSVEILVDALAMADSKLVYISSDNVFDGMAQTYCEFDAPSPVNVYGETKLAAERVVLSDPRHLVLRIPILYGPCPWANKFLARYRAETIKAQTDVLCTPLYLPSLASGIEQLWDRTGVLHFAGRQALTRFELMSGVRQELGLRSRVIPALEHELGSDFRRPKRLVLRSERQPLAGPDLETALRHWKRAAAELDPDGSTQLSAPIS